MRRALALIAVVACGGGDVAAPDAGPDAPVVALPSCEPTFEHAYIERRLQLEGAGLGRDIDGDGDIDNVLGLFASLFNANIQRAIDDGEFIGVFVLPGLVIPPPDEPVTFAGYWPLATDKDSPPDPTNNFDDGEFIVSLSSFDASCRPPPAVPIVQTGTALVGSANAPTLGTFGLLDLRAGEFEAEVSEDGLAIAGRITGAFPSCGLDRAPAAGANPGSVLRNISAVLGLQPDIDLDGDGLELIVSSDDDQIIGCIDGDGTAIDSPTCACDPRIADGFSASAQIEAVPARIVGTAP